MILRVFAEWDPCENVCVVGQGIQPVQPRRENERKMNRQRVCAFGRAGEKKILPGNHKGFDVAFSRIVVDLHAAIREEGL